MSTGKCSLLVVDDEPSILPTLAALLVGDFEVHTASSADLAQVILERSRIDLVLTDQRMPRRTGIELLEWVKQHRPRTVRLLMTGYGELEDAVEAINRGQIYYFLQKPWHTEELLQILRNAAEKVLLERKQDQLLQELQQLNLELEQRVHERTSELEQANLLLQQRTRELERLVLIDPLTGLFNRRAMDGLALAELKRHSRYHNPLSLGLADVDFFKQINTAYDLTGGDEVLKGLARILTSSLREVDSVGRVGGEEFLIIARETDEVGANSLAERTRSMVEQTPIEFQGQQIRITISLGFAVAESNVATDFPTMYDIAAKALGLAKRMGRNRFVIRCLDPAVERSGTPTP